MRLVPTDRTPSAIPRPSAASRARARRDTLILDHMHLVPPIARWAKAHLPPSFELDDLINSGNLALIRAASRYQPGAHGNASFASFACPSIRGGILDSVRRRNYEEATRPPLPLGKRIDGFYTEAHLEGIDQRALSGHLARAIADLSPRHRAVVQRCFLGGVTRKGVSRALGLKRYRIDETKAEALAELRRRLSWVGVA
jgi:RNA polymerase sigma factor (sigma-70 family)